MKAKVSCISTIICLITLVFFFILACDNGSAPDSVVSETDGLVKVSLSVDGDSSSIQKSASLDGANFTFYYKAVPQWSQTKTIAGSTDNQFVQIPNYTSGDSVSVGYFAPGQWVFYIRILSGSTPIYEGHSAVITVSKTSANVTVAVAKIIQEATEGAVSISITAPTFDQNTDALTVGWSGTASGSAAATATASGGVTTFTYYKDDLAFGTYTFTFTHSNVNNNVGSITVTLQQGRLIAISGGLSNGVWDLGYLSLQLHDITVVKHNWGTPEEPEYCGTVDLDSSSAVKGDRVSFTPKPVKNSSVAALTITCGGDDVTFSRQGDLYSFVMPDGDVTINVTFAHVTPEETNALLFKIAVQSLYNENIATVESFGQAAGGPGVGDNPTTLGDVKIWYDSTNHKVCWYSEADKIKLSAGSLTELFKDCVRYTSISLNKIITTNVTNMSGMFQGCTGLTSLNLSNFNASGATDISNMFQGCTGLTSLTLTGFTTSNTSGVNMAGLFKDCSSLSSITLPATLYTGKATSLAGFFQGCSSLSGTLNLTNFDASSATDISSMFQGCSNLTALTLTGFTTNSTSSVNMARVFKGCSKLSSISLPASFNTSKATSLAGFFQGCSGLRNTLNLTNFDASSATDVSEMFQGCSNLTGLTLTGFTLNTTSPFNMAGMFHGCVNLTGTLNLSSFNTTQATDMSYMFCECRGLTGITIDTTKDGSGKFVKFSTANVTNMACMFSSQYEATEEPAAMNLTNLDVSGFDTAKVTSMKQMFYLCYKLPSLDVAGFRTPLVTDMSYMFACYNYLSSTYPGKIPTLNLENWDFTNVKTVAHMFDRQQELVNLTFPTTTNFKSLTTMTYLFSHCLALTPAKFTTIVGSWKFSEQTDWQKNIYGENHTQPNKSMFGNYESNSAGQNAGANYIFREKTMTPTGGLFETRSGYTTQDGRTLYIGGGSSMAHARLTTKETL